MNMIKLLFVPFLGLSALAAPLDVWTTRSGQSTPVLRDITFGDGQFVGAGDGFAVSRDSQEWTYIAASPSMFSVAAGNGRYLGVGGNVVSILEGGVLIQRQITGVQNFDSIAFGNGRFVAIGQGGRISVSTTGDFWNTFDSQFGDLFRASFNGGRFFASGINGKTYSSTDGLTWIEVAAVTLGEVVTVNGSYYSGRNQRTSLDGVVWTATTAPPTLMMTSLIEAPGLAVGTDGSTIWASIDGVNWASQPTGSPTTIHTGLAFGHGRVVLVGHDAGRGVILVSGSFPAGSSPVLEASTFAGVSVTGTIGRSYRIDAATSADATEWTPIGQITLVRSPQTWFDEASPALPRRFYRAVLLP